MSKPNKKGKAKTRKAVLKRFKITKNGKVLRRQTGLDHYRRKKSGSFKRQKRKMTEMSKGEAKKIKKLLRF